MNTGRVSQKELMIVWKLSGKVAMANLQPEPVELDSLARIGTAKET
jgi:hypothetical protein